MSGAVEALRHLELMALNTAQTAAAATKVNECVALLSASRTTPPAQSYADDDQVYAKGRQDGYAAGRSHALDDAAKVAEDLTFGTEIGEWLAMTKKEVSARACHECAAAIRLLSQGGKADV